MHNPLPKAVHSLLTLTNTLNYFTGILVRCTKARVGWYRKIFSLFAAVIAPALFSYLVSLHWLYIFCSGTAASL